jgi:hypothetical protein
MKEPRERFPGFRVITRLSIGGCGWQPAVESASAGDADPGALLRRRRREVALI